MRGRVEVCVSEGGRRGVTFNSFQRGGARQVFVGKNRGGVFVEGVAGEGGGRNGGHGRRGAQSERDVQEESAGRGSRGGEVA